ncbi:hypothetical protein [Ideonella alba]|uniref:Uncharacterized protein n=1 Tax=Ideonella alba TaxID=2824118 RepID=A0A940Y6Z1_9BURK|nr:hypothetical protein [Ideonella alba]MBQ0931269.1 hypothetical protein [Ideonella alba]
MFDWIKRKRPAAGPTDLAALEAWAQLRGWQFKPARTQDGFVIESADWRLEWGPSHRAYLGPQEMRLRATLDIEPEAHAVVLPRALQAALEAELYQSFTGSVRTHLDEALPEEVRWLAVSTRLGSAELGPLRDALGAAGNVDVFLRAWLSGPTGELLAQAMQRDATMPLVVTLQQSVLTLRAGLAQAEPVVLAELVALFEQALGDARHCLDSFADGPPAGDPP